MARSGEEEETCAMTDKKKKHLLVGSSERQTAKKKRAMGTRLSSQLRERRLFRDRKRHKDSSSVLPPGGRGIC